MGGILGIFGFFNVWSICKLFLCLGAQCLFFTNHFKKNQKYQKYQSKHRVCYTWGQKNKKYKSKHRVCCTWGFPKPRIPIKTQGLLHLGPKKKQKYQSKHRVCCTWGFKKPFKTLFFLLSGGADPMF